MSNEEFNKLDMKTLLEQHTMELKSVIPTLESSLNDITPLIRILIEQYGDFIKEALKAVPQALLNAIGQSGGEFANVPTTNNQTGSNVPVTMASFLHFFKTISDATNIPESELIKKEETPTIIIDKNKPTKQELIDEAMLKAKLRAQLKTQLVPQLSIIEKSRSRKRKAGQSQKLERNNLSFRISSQNKQLQAMIKVTPNFRNLSTRDPKRVSIGMQFKAIRTTQQSLINLLARYDFS